MHQFFQKRLALKKKQKCFFSLRCEPSDMLSPEILHPSGFLYSILSVFVSAGLKSSSFINRRSLISPWFVVNEGQSWQLSIQIYRLIYSHYLPWPNFVWDQSWLTAVFLSVSGYFESSTRKSDYCFYILITINGLDYVSYLYYVSYYRSFSFSTTIGRNHGEKWANSKTIH